MGIGVSIFTNRGYAFKVEDTPKSKYEQGFSSKDAFLNTNPEFPTVSKPYTTFKGGSSRRESTQSTKAEVQPKSSMATSPSTTKISVDNQNKDLINKQIDIQQSREKQFYQSPAFQRVEATSSFITFGGGKPASERGVIGATAQGITTNIMLIGTPAFGGFLASTGEKLYIEGSKIKAGFGSSVREDLFGRKQISSTIKETFTPSSIGTALIFGGFKAGSKIQSERSKTVFSDFPNVEQIKQETIVSRNVIREQSSRYVKTDLIPNTDYVVSDIIKSKSTIVSENIKEINLKFNLFDTKTGREGVRNIYLDPNSGKTVVTERIMQSNALFRNSKDYFKITSPKEGKFNVQVFNTADYFGKTSPKPLINKDFSSGMRVSSISTVKSPKSELTSEDLKFAKQSTSQDFEKKVLIGEYIQTTTSKESIFTKYKLEKPRIVDTSKEFGLRLTTKGTSIGLIESVKSQKAKPVFGKDQLYPNLLQKEGFKILETKQPQQISETVINRQISINLRKASPSEIKDYTGKDIFSFKSSLSELSGKEIKSFGKVYDSNNRVSSIGGLKTELINTPRQISSTKSITLNPSKELSFTNLGSYTLKLSEPKVRSNTEFPLMFSSRIGSSSSNILNSSSSINFISPSNRLIDIPSNKMITSPYIESRISPISKPSYKIISESKSETKSIIETKVSNQLDYNYKNNDILSSRNNLPYYRQNMFNIPFNSGFSLKGKGKSKKLKSSNVLFAKPSKSNVYILPDLASVSSTELLKFGKGYANFEATAPRATKRVQGLSLSAFKGYGGFVPTEEMRKTMRY